MSGELIVTKIHDPKQGNLLCMDFPAYTLKMVPVTCEMEEALGVRPLEAYMGRDLLCVLESESQVLALHPDMNKVKALPGLLLHVTAKANENAAYQCVSRSFAPKLNVKEDPVCGSGHCHIIPYWAEKLGENALTARQASARGGMLCCQMGNDRVTLAGKAAVYLMLLIF